MSETYTLSEVSRLTGVKPRTIQFWTQSGVIRCDPETEHGGPGVPRRYPEDEVAIALVVGEISRMPLQVGALREIADRLREIIHYGESIGLRDWEEGEARDDEQFQKYLEMRRSESAAKNAPKFKRDMELVRWIRYERARLAIFNHPKDSDVMLFLTVDDVGRWQLQIDDYGQYKEVEKYDTKAPAVWALQLQLNLTRSLARLRV